MSLFQIIIGFFTFICFIWFVLKCIRGVGRYARILNGSLAIIWALGCLMVIKPDLLNVAAGFFGITRGVDLVLYIFMMLVFCYIIFTYYQLCDIRKDITLVVRHLAIVERRIPEDEKNKADDDDASLKKEE